VAGADVDAARPDRAAGAVTVATDGAAADVVGAAADVVGAAADVVGAAADVGPAVGVDTATVGPAVEGVHRATVGTGA